MNRGLNPVVASREAIRRLAVTRQHLAGRVPRRSTAKSILGLIRDLGCLQLDPINVVAPSHLIVLWSRLGDFDQREFEKLLWKDRSLFEYWGHQASIVLTEDYPLYYGMMRRRPGSTPTPWWPSRERRVERWLGAHLELRKYVLAELERRGPLSSREFGHPTASKRKGTGWGAVGDLTEMLEILFLRGEVMVAGREGRLRIWDLPERYLPRGGAESDLTHDEVEYQAVQRSLSALGIASAVEIRYHFLRNRYPNLARTLERLLAESKIHQVTDGRGSAGPARYIHHNDLRLLDAIEAGTWQPRTTLLSPFDNLICDRARTERLFDFRFRFEGYVPEAKREYGPYVLPILQGERLIGRIDPLLDRSEGKLRIRGVHLEKRAPRDLETAKEVGEAVRGLARFLGASETEYSGVGPPGWKGVLS
jgi:uncharacterized protein